MKKWALLPFALFIVIVAFLAVGLNRDPSVIPSPFVDRPAPDFNAVTLLGNQTPISNRDMLGKIWLLNVWASWCAACLDEHPLLNALHQNKIVEIVGLNYKDTDGDAIQWLERNGNPYQQIVVDRSGDIGIDYGVYGVPETFLIDQAGVVRFKHIGALTEQDIVTKLIPLVNKLNVESG